MLANYLKNEYPQTDRGGAVEAASPSRPREMLAISAGGARRSTSSNRMLKMEAVQKDVMERVEQTLRTEFMSNLSRRPAAATPTR